MSAIAGIDQALWDIKGKYYKMPVYEMLGGAVKNRFKVYRSIRGETVEEYIADAKRAKEQGYVFIKMVPHQATHYIDNVERVDDLLAKVAAVRETAGHGIDLAVDFHGRIHKSMAKVMARELDQFRLAFIEEPVLPTNKEALREIARYTSSPIALGERVYNRWEFKEIFIDGYVDIVQPDLSHAGGISECRRIGAMAEAFDVAYAPHCPLSVIAFAACIQTDIATPNAVFQEQSIDIHDGRKENEKLKWLKNPGQFAFDKGFVAVPQGPGLGIEPDEEAIAEAGRNRHNWKNPLWRTYDGTPIEW
jgi:galactonate dehydratase